MSTPVNSSLNVQSCNVHPYELISHCPMLQWLPPVNSPLIVQCCNDYPLWSHLSMFSPAMSTPVNSSFNAQSCNVHPREFIFQCSVLQCPPLWTHLSMSSPAMSTPVNSSLNVQSCNVHSCEFISQCPILQCPPRWIHLSMSSSAMSAPVNSIPSPAISAVWTDATSPKSLVEDGQRMRPMDHFAWLDSVLRVSFIPFTLLTAWPEVHLTSEQVVKLIW